MTQFDQLDTNTQHSIYQVLSQFKSYDPSQTGFVNATVFSNILSECGIENGSTVGDFILLNSSIQGNGELCYTPLQNKVDAFYNLPDKNETIQSNDAVNVQECVTADVTQGNITIDQHQKVQLSSSRLRELYNEYDTGQLSANGLRNAIRELGLEETSAFKAVLRHASYNMSYAQFIRALAQTDNGLENEVAGSVHLRPPMSMFYDAPIDDSIPPAAPSQPPPHIRSNNIFAKQDFNALSQSESTTREKVYNIIRQLDGGEITVDEFQQLLQQHNIPVTANLSRLLAKHKAAGSAKFHEFVKVLDPLLCGDKQSIKLSDSNLIQGFRGMGVTEQHDNTKQVANKPLPMAQQTHGDFISWKGAPSCLENQANEAAIRGRRHVQNEKKTELLRLGAVDMLTWDNEGKGEEHHPYHPSSGLFPSSGDIISWANAKPEPTMANKNRATMRRTALPYGTDADITSNTNKNYSVSAPYDTTS